MEELFLGKSFFVSSLRQNLYFCFPIHSLHNRSACKLFSFTWFDRAIKKKKIIDPPPPPPPQRDQFVGPQHNKSFCNRAFFFPVVVVVVVVDLSHKVRLKFTNTLHK